MVSSATMLGSILGSLAGVALLIYLIPTACCSRRQHRSNQHHSRTRHHHRHNPSTHGHRRTPRASPYQQHQRHTASSYQNELSQYPDSSTELPYRDPRGRRGMDYSIVDIPAPVHMQGSDDGGDIFFEPMDFGRRPGIQVVSEIGNRFVEDHRLGRAF